MITSEFASLFKPLRPYLPPSLRDSLTTDFQYDDGLAILDHIRSLRSVLSTYLPHYLVKRITSDASLGKRDGEFRYGTVMFADVSGFTAMSKKLSALGKEGAEEMTGIVNDYFDSMLAISDAFTGDLLKFGGDALLLYFEGYAGAERALTAAQAMQTAMDKYDVLNTSQGVFTLRMSIGIGSGDIFFSTLGIEAQMNYVVMGSVLANMAQAEDIAEAGQIVVDGPTREATLARAAYTPLGKKLWLFHNTLVSESHAEPPEIKSGVTLFPQPSSLNEILEDCLSHASKIEALRPFVPDELLKRLIPDPNKSILYGSHRLVTVMFLNFYGVDELIEELGPEHCKSITEILNIYFVKMGAIISRYGGTISRVDSYIIGQRILALFGALRAHEDDPQRAIRAGLEMNRVLEEVNLQVAELLEAIPDLNVEFNDAAIKQRIAINSGFVFAANVGSANRREFTVMGDQVNVTARLMSKSRDGEVLIGHATAKSVEANFELEEQKSVKVKGIDEALRPFLVIHPRELARGSRHYAATPLIGRQKELAKAQEAAQRSLQANGQILIIYGVSGIGKTRLVEEIIAYGTGLGMELLLGTSLSYGSTLTYHPWAEILGTYFRVRASDAPSIRIKALEKGMQAIGEQDWTPVIGTVLGLDIDENELTRDLDAKLRRQRVLDLMVKLLQYRAQAQPLLLILEDAHWADSASMELINYLLRNIFDQPILMVLPHRPDDGLPNWKAQPNSVEIHLQEMSDEPSIAIIQGMIGPIQVPASIQDLILKKAGGNPFFIGELVRSLMDTGVLDQDSSGTWQFNEEEISVDLPDTVHGVIISRIDRLDEHDRVILQAASVVGRDFPVQTLMGVLSQNGKDQWIDSRLNHMHGMGLIELADMEAGNYRFIHLTTREVVYESLSFGLRRNLHTQIGEFIEDTFTGSLREHTNMLAYHYFLGQSWSKALDYNLQGGHYAQTEFANDIAITSFENALEAAGKLEEDNRTLRDQELAHEALGEVLTLVGRYDEAMNHYNAARAILETESHWEEQPLQLADLARKTADVLERQSEYAIAFEWLHKGLSYVDKFSSSIATARIYLMGAGLHHRQGNNEKATEWCQKSLATTAKIRTREGQHVTAHTYYLLGAAQYRLSEFEFALESCEQSLRLYDEIDDYLGQARAYNNLAIVYSDLGNWEKSSEAYHKSLTMNKKIGNIQDEGFVANNLGNINLYRGEWDKAETYYLDSKAIWKRIGAPLPEAVTLSNLAQVYIYRENLTAAESTLHESQTIFNKIGSKDFLPEIERRWGEFYLHRGELAEAKKHTQLSIELAGKLDARLEEGMSLRVLGEVDLVMGDYDSAKIALQQSLNLLNELKSEYEAAKTKLALARLAMQMQKPSQEKLAEVLRTFAKLGALEDLRQAKVLEKQLSNPKK